MNTISDDVMIRTYRGDEDIARIAALYSACSQVDGPEYSATEHDTRRLMTAPKTLPYENVFLCELGGETVAYGRVQLDEGPEESVFNLRGIVHPEYRRRGIGSRLFDRLELQVSQRLDEAANVKVLASTWTPLMHEDRIALFTSKGYVPGRYFFDMERPLREDGRPLELPEAPYPPGIVVQTFEERPDLAAAHLATNEAFRDHWGHTEDSLEDWQHWFDNDPHYRPDWWLLARDAETDDVAGFCLNAVDPDVNERKGRQDGWVDVLAVRRPYRNRGLGRALLVAGMTVLQEAGFEWAMLGVDSENLTGALRLYESVGFRAAKKSAAYRKVLRNG